jgi:voltage-gated potassium channel
MTESTAEPLALRGHSPRYQLFMLALCIFALLVMVLDFIYARDEEVGKVLDYADNVVCAVFFIDFAISFQRAPKKWRYLATWGWLDLLSSFPTFDYARWGRIARIARLARVLRALRASRMLGKMLARKRGQSAAVAAALLALFLIVGCSVAILRLEDSSEATIKTSEDAVWWAFATITTVGYGDKYPLSTEGRIVAALLMTAGVGLFGAFSAALAAWFLTPEEEAMDAELAKLSAEMARLARAVESLTVSGSLTVSQSQSRTEAPPPRSVL